MAIKSTNDRVGLTIPKDLLAKVDLLADMQKVSRNAVILSLIEMSIDTQIKFWEAMRNPTTLSQMYELASKFSNPEQLNEIKEFANKINDPSNADNVKGVDNLMNKMKSKNE